MKILNHEEQDILEIRCTDSHQCAVGHCNGTGCDQLYGVN